MGCENSVQTQQQQTPLGSPLANGMEGELAENSNNHNESIVRTNSSSPGRGGSYLLPTPQQKRSPARSPLPQGGGRSVLNTNFLYEALPNGASSPLAGSPISSPRKAPMGPPPLLASRITRMSSLESDGAGTMMSQGMSAELMDSMESLPTGAGYGYTKDSGEFGGSTPFEGTIASAAGTDLTEISVEMAADTESVLAEITPNEDEGGRPAEEPQDPLWWKPKIDKLMLLRAKAKAVQRRQFQKALEAQQNQKKSAVADWNQSNELPPVTPSTPGGEEEVEGHDQASATL